MKRISTFITGMLVGGALVYMALHYHLVRATDGMHLVPKAESSIASTYVDIRSFGPRDWLDHPNLAAAMMKSGQEELMDSTMDNTLQNGIDRLLGSPQNGR
ncbi:hypothetical protein [Adhaeretor mobilis]|uniref:Uncharacterized protein n=1 Tax=Adhaeretor mobilis TaxID=1930276 RepID=A0A517MT55_9BACT|nr:hypothetical protein [Adhaeretor mobilis]QDS98059.1 hypothetical protein HG15A2_13300 [Adhaeretor mobilis]